MEILILLNVPYCIIIFTIIKWTIFLLSAQNSHLANYLGDFSYFYGPKLLVNFILIFCASFDLSTFIIFYFSSKHPKKMLFWLEQMQFDIVNRRFNKLNFNKSDSNTFIRRMSLLKIIYSITVYALIPILLISINYSAFKHQKAYFYYYFISSLIYCPQFYLNLSCSFGFLVIFYQVLSSLINYI